MATPEALDEFFRASSEYARVNRAEINAAWLAQRQRELQIISEGDTLCPLPRLNHFEMRAEDVQRAFDERFGDGNVLRAIMCVNNTLAIYPASAGLTRNYKIRHYIRKLRQIGGESVSGYALASTIKAKGDRESTDEPFVVKSPRVLNPDTNYEQTHEYFVGAYGTNNLRNRIPTFSYIMGMFKCSPPYIDAKKQVLTFCQNDDPKKQVVYLLYENIKKSMTLFEYIVKGCTLQQFLNIWLQILFSLDLAFRKFRYTHEDLHSRNVLVEELPEEIFIPYIVDTRGTVRYIKTRFLARIIDLGRSYIEYNGEPFGYALYEGGIYLDTPYPMYDIYKLLLTCLAASSLGDQSVRKGLMDSEIRLTNPEVFNGIKQFLGFFDPQILRGPDGSYNGVVDYLLRTRQYYYSLPYDPQWDRRPIEFYEEAVLPRANVESIFGQTEDQDKIYGCASKGICLTLQQAVGRYAQLDLDLLDDPYVFYEMLYDTVDKDPEEAKSLLGEGAGRFGQYMARLRQEAQKYFEEYTRIINQLSIYSLVGPGRESLLFRDPYLSQYLDYLGQVVRAIDLLTSLRGAITIMKFLVDQYPYLSQDEIIPSYRIESTILDRAIRSIQNDINHVRRMDRNILLRINPKIDLLTNRLISVSYALSL